MHKRCKDQHRPKLMPANEHHSCQKCAAGLGGRPTNEAGKDPWAQRPIKVGIYSEYG